MRERMTPKAGVLETYRALSRSYPAPFWLNVRALRIASLLFLLLAAASVHAQAPPLSLPSLREAPRPGQDFLSWLRHLVPTQRSQSRAVSSIPLPRPRPAELTTKPIEPSNAPAELAPASVDPAEAPAELAPAPDGSKEQTAPVPLND